jgi:tRNA1Val (adenine37-N6)-methyltransferase
MSDDYLQPNFYRFNEDSLILVNWILQNKANATSVLDLGAGSGIIGIELAAKLKSHDLTLLELQPEFLPFLEMNCRKFLPSTVKCEIIIKSFNEYIALKKYDLIVSNPPYYLPDSSRLSPHRQRALARTFTVDGWKVLLELIERSLKYDGEAYLVVKHDNKLLSLIATLAQQQSLQLIQHNVDHVVILRLFALNID